MVRRLPGGYFRRLNKEHDKTFKQIGIDIGKSSFHVVGMGTDGSIML